MAKTTIVDNGVTRLDVGIIEDADAYFAHSLIMGATYDYTTGIGKLPPDAFASASRDAAWNAEVAACVRQDGGAFAAGVWRSASGVEAGNLVAVLLARPRIVAPADSLVIVYETEPDDEKGGTALARFACREAEARGKRLVRRVERVDYVTV